MKAEVKIPRGWRRVPTGAAIKDRDFFLRYYAGGPSDWYWEVLSDVDDDERVQSDELIIRKVEEPRRKK